MRGMHFRTFIGASLLAIGLAAAPSLAQDTAGTRPYTTTTSQEEDEGKDWGWIGLLGLAGLLGLRRREPVYQERVDTTRERERERTDPTRNRM